MNISSVGYLDFVGRAPRPAADPLVGLVGQADSLPIRRPPACATYLVVDRGLKFGETRVTDGQLRLSLTRRRRPKHKVVR
jgi:hypothetical protein